MDNPLGTRKQVIYLDQFLISNFALALSAPSPRQERPLKEPFWLEAYRTLDHLLKLQLIVCPESSSHRMESIPSRDPSFEALQGVYTCFANDCRFRDYGSTLSQQLLCHFESYLEGHPEREPEISTDEAIDGDPHEWQDPFRIAVLYHPEGQEATALRTHRAQHHERLVRAFEPWKTETSSFDEIVKGEARSFWEAIIRDFLSHLRNNISPQSEAFNLGTFLSRLPSPGAQLVYDMIRILEESGRDNPLSNLKTIGEYLRSDHLLRVPFVRLLVLLNASLARKARSGRRAPPSKGTTTDVTTIASLLPYCQAMFLDNEMAGHLRDEPLKSAVGAFGTRIFSLKTKGDFLAYLHEIEASAGERHRLTVMLTYGPDWLLGH